MTSTNQLLQDLMAKGLTQRDIVHRASIGQSRVSRWIAGEVPRGADAALRLQRLHAEVCGAVPAPAPQQPGAAG